MASRSIAKPTAIPGNRADLWRWGFAVAAAISLTAFLLNAMLSEIHPGNTWGLAYGIAAAVMLAGAGLYGLRRRAMRTVSRWKLGRARAWLDFHVYGGLLFLLLVLMHSGFRWPTGALTWWLWGLAVWTVASGLFGLALQRWIPRVLSTGLSVEVNYDRIPELVQEIRGKAEELVVTCDPAVARLYRRLAKSLRAPRRDVRYFTDITGGIHDRLREFEYLGRFLSAEEKAKLDRLEQLFRSKLEIDAHYTLQQALRLWLWLHVPTSALLAALVVLHVVTVIYY